MANPRMYARMSLSVPDVHAKRQAPAGESRPLKPLLGGRCDNPFYVKPGSTPHQSQTSSLHFQSP